MSDPSAIRSLAISTGDLVAAVEATTRERTDVVLRVTPPFSGRMRARIHVVQQGSTDDETVHISPLALLDADAPPFPTPDETADELRETDDEAYSVERHRTYHEQRVTEWRASLPDHVVDRTAVPAVGHEVSISLLGE